MEKEGENMNEKTCWVSYLKSSGKYIIVKKESYDAPAHCLYSFDCVAVHDKNIQAVNADILLIINELIDSGYIFLGIIWALL